MKNLKFIIIVLFLSSSFALQAGSRVTSQSTRVGEDGSYYRLVNQKVGISDSFENLYIRMDVIYQMKGETASKEESTIRLMGVDMSNVTYVEYLKLKKLIEASPETTFISATDFLVTRRRELLLDDLTVKNKDGSITALRGSEYFKSIDVSKEYNEDDYLRYLRTVSIPHIKSKVDEEYLFENETISCNIFTSLGISYELVSSFCGENRDYHQEEFEKLGAFF